MPTMKFNLVKDEDKKHSVKFKPATDADAKFCSAFYLSRPYSDGLNKITVVIQTDELIP
ncbi:MAG TPA: hypothetical protein VFH87_14230 [Candidatus Udaeobacter sp.]|nr:hypothetical protein [Candidatus Udaeobacter sp.]